MLYWTFSCSFNVPVIRLFSFFVLNRVKRAKDFFLFHTKCELVLIVQQRNNENKQTKAGTKTTLWN